MRCEGSGGVRRYVLMYAFTHVCARVCVCVCAHMYVRMYVLLVASARKASFMRDIHDFV